MTHGAMALLIHKLFAARTLYDKNSFLKMNKNAFNYSYF